MTGGVRLRSDTASMLLTTTAAALRDLLGHVRHVVPSTPSLAAYSGVLLSVDAAAQTLTVLASDGETSIAAHATVTEADAGSFLVLPKPLMRYLATLDADRTVTLAVTSSGDLEITPQGLSSYSFRPLSSTFPTPAQPDGEPQPVSFDHVPACLAAIRSAVARENQAVQVLSAGAQVTFNATDGYRLAQATAPGAGFGTFSGVLPLPVLERAARLGTTAVAVDTTARLVAFSSPTVTLTARLLAVPFPAVETVIDTAPPTVTRIAAGELLDGLARLVSVAEQAPLRVRLEQDQLQLEASTAELGAGSETVTLASPVAAPFELMVRGEYLHDAVTALGRASVEVAYSGPVQPLFLSTDQPCPLLYVVMPVRS